MKNRTLALSLWLLVATVFGILVFLSVSRAPTAAPVAPENENLYTQFSIPEFELTDRDGARVTHGVLDGEYTVVDFFFTSCPLYCPGMTNAMRRVQDETAGTGLRFMSVSIDGGIDTPEVIDSYATRYGVDPDRWVFATGDPDVVAEIVREGLRFDLGDPQSEDEGRLINHPTRLILLGPDRRVIDLYRYEDSDQIDELIARARGLVGG